jgi:hypothetical protein
MVNRRKTMRKRGGGPKARKSKNVTEKKSAGSASPLDRCGICLEDMDKPRLVKKTKCGHRFHRECLKMWCNSPKQPGLGTRCPFCNASIEKDCESVQTDQPMPDHRIRDLLFSEDFEEHSSGATGREIQERRTRKQAFLKKLRFPKKFGYEDWNKITNFKKACDAATNLEQVRAEFAT